MLLQTIEALFRKYRLFCYRKLFSAVREKPGSLSATEAFSADIIHLLGSPTISQFADTIGISQPNATYKVNQLVSNLKNEGKTIIILTHEIEKCLGLADIFIVLFRGKKVFEGTPQMALQQNLEQWNIRNPVCSYKSLQDFIW